MTPGATAAWATASSELHPARFLRGLRGRMRERAFWIIQAGVLAATVLHVVLEAVGPHPHDSELLGMLRHIPVILYIVPVSYAGFRYGFEGSALTGAWAALLATPNLFIWHAGGFEWLGELLMIVVVISIGMVIAIPVEREQRERARAEAAGRRLALLNDVTASLLRTADLDDALRGALGQLLRILPLRSVTLRAADGRATHRTHHVPAEEEPDELHDHGRDPATVSDNEPWATGMLCFPLSAGDGDAMLCAEVLDGHALTTGDRELIATVGAEIGIALDNARLHRLNEERLHSYVHQVTRAQEEERLRISREIHDVATHELLMLCRDLDVLVDLPRDGQVLSDRAHVLRERAEGVVEYLRRFSRDLRPTTLDNLGLAPALQWLTMQLSDETGADARFRLIGEPVRLGPDVELALFRVAQEALRNAERHAEARRMAVSLTYDGDQVEMEVSDDGIGFEVPDRLDGMVPAGKLGLVGMRERVQLVGGQFRIDSRSGKGTSVHVSVSTQPAVLSTAAR